MSQVVSEPKPPYEREGEVRNPNEIQLRLMGMVQEGVSEEQLDGTVGEIARHYLSSLENRLRVVLFANGRSWEDFTDFLQSSSRSESTLAVSGGNLPVGALPEFTDRQLDTINLFSWEMSEEERIEIEHRVALASLNQLSDKIDSAVEAKGITEEDVEAWLNHDDQ